MLKVPYGFSARSYKCDEPLSKFAFELMLHRYMQGAPGGEGEGGGGGASAGGGKAAGKAAAGVGGGVGVLSGGGGVPAPLFRSPEVVLLDSPSGKLPMLAVGGSVPPPGTLAPPGGGGGGGVWGGAGAVGAVGGGGGAGAAVFTGGAGAVGVGGEAAAGLGGGAGGAVLVPAAAPHPQSIVMNVNGTMRRLQPVCAQALPWSTSFIGCPGVRCADGSDFTTLFRADGTRDAGNRRTTPLEVEPGM